MGKKKNKNKNLDVAFADSEEEITNENLNIAQEKQPATQQKKRGKGKKGKGKIFDSDEDINDNFGITKENNEEEIIDNDTSTVGKNKKQNKKKNKNQKLEEFFDNESEDNEEIIEEEINIQKIKNKKDKKIDLKDALSALEIESDNEEEEAFAEEEIEEEKESHMQAGFVGLEIESDNEEEEAFVEEEKIEINKKEKKKKKEKNIEDIFSSLEQTEENDMNMENEKNISFKEKIKEDESNVIIEHEHEEEEEVNVKKNKKKKKKNFDALFASVEENEINDVEIKEEEELVKENIKTKKDKKKNKKSLDDIFAKLDTEEEEDVVTQEAVTEENNEENAIIEGNNEDEQINSVEEIQIKQKEIPDQKSKSKEKKKGKKGKGGRKNEDDDDIDKILAEIERKPKSDQKSKQEPVITEEKLENTETSIKSEEVTKDSNNTLENEDKSESNIKSNTEKEIMDEKTEESESKGKKKTKKIPAHIRKLKEQLEQQKLAEEKAKKEEEERIKREEEEARLAEEKRKEEEERKKKEEEKRRLEAIEKRKQEAKLKKYGKFGMDMSTIESIKNQVKASAALNNTNTKIDDNKSKVKGKKQKDIEEKKKKEEEERLKLIQEEEEKKKQELEEEKKKKNEEEAKIKAEKEAILDDWEDFDVNEQEEVKEEEIKETVVDQIKEEEVKEENETDSEEESESEEESLDSEEERERQVENVKRKLEERIQEAKEAANPDKMRSPICCILGHVDTGKTKILDNIRQTNVQDNEAGGITQQIGATYIPKEALLSRTESLRKGREYELKVPGLLVIDTPGHESFTNLRSRGSSLCDIAILVVDMMHGLEPQTLESIELLRQKKTPFIICLNKVDRLTDWKLTKNAPIRECLTRQKKHTTLDFESRLTNCTTMLMEQGLNVSLYWKNKDPKKVVNMVPTSAITGEGIPDMLQLLVKLTTSWMVDKLTYLSELQCTVLEVKAIEGLGTTIDVVLVNGEISEGERIVVCGMSGPIVTTIRSLLTPHPLKELRVKGTYLHHKKVQAAQGIKICAQNLENAVAGTSLHVVKDDNEEECKLLAEEEMREVLSRIDKTGEGVCVQASTLGSLEALLEFLKTPEVGIPVSAVAIGPVHKKDVMRANVMNEKKLKKYSVILAFDVPVTKEAREMAEELGVTIFTADIIYHLFDQFTAYINDIRQAEKQEASVDAVFPCVLNILPNCIFNKKDPIILGCEVVEGQLRINTPIVAIGPGIQEEVSLGRIESMELSHKTVEKANVGDSIAIKIRGSTPDETARLYGRHFDHKNQLVSKITRTSINALKSFFKDEMSREDWQLVIKLKRTFGID